LVDHARRVAGGDGASWPASWAEQAKSNVAGALKSRYVLPGGIRAGPKLWV
jgi:hypothetical protein